MRQHRCSVYHMWKWRAESAEKKYSNQMKSNIHEAATLLQQQQQQQQQMEHRVCVSM